MQEPTRYYITKRDEEPTVRSVKVARGVPEGEDPDARSDEAAAELTAPERPTSAPARAVERLVKGAIRGRVR